jgi:AraC-like DNA-binding protein
MPLDLRQSTGARALILSIPAHTGDRALWRYSRPAARLNLASGLGRVVAGMVTELAHERATLTDTEFDAVCDRVVDLLTLLSTDDDGPVRAPGRLEEVEALARRHIREHAADPGLDTAQISRALGWSTRQIQLALQHSGTTPRELIRQERLRMARELLLDPVQRHLTIDELAHRTGFPSAGALSTAFRRYCGLSPRELRQSGAAPAS